MNKLDGFWKQMMPGLGSQIAGGVTLSAICDRKGYEKGIKSFIKGMDEDEFNLFLAQVVMMASSKQIMGVGLTEQIVFLKTLRK